MKNTDLQRITHIKRYCERIAESINRYGADYKTFLNDYDYRNSVSMSILQIGELSIGLTKEFKDATKNQIAWSDMRIARNIYAHAYNTAEKSLIWKTATNDVPALLLFCNKVIEQESTREVAPLANEKPSILKRIDDEMAKNTLKNKRSPKKKDNNIDL